MNHFRVNVKWLHPILKNEANYLQNLAPKLFQDNNKLVWVRLNDYKYPRMALYLPAKYRKLALCEAHNNQFGGHNAALKTYIQIPSSYFWVKIYTDVLNHTKSCLRWQQIKIWQTNHPSFNLCPFWTNLTSGYTQTFSARCSQQDINTNTSSASRTLSPNTRWSQLWKTKRLKPWLKPFFHNGFVNSASQRRFTLTAGRSLSTNYLTSFSHF